jgi:ruvA, C-terminal domain
LISLGYSQQEAENAISKIKGENLTIEDYIKLALKQM